MHGDHIIQRDDEAGRRPGANIFMTGQNDIGRFARFGSQDEFILVVAPTGIVLNQIQVQFDAQVGFDLASTLAKLLQRQSSSGGLAIQRMVMLTASCATAIPANILSNSTIQQHGEAQLANHL